MTEKIVKFEKETELCAAFLRGIPDTWQAYPETSGFDILLVRKADGFQIGIEAKLKLNTKVICQVAEPVHKWYQSRSGPDCRAVLVPNYAATELAEICSFLGITIIQQYHPSDEFNFRHNNRPELPRLGIEHTENYWFEFAPLTRCYVPDYIPDVIAGDSGPVALTAWKIGAIKLAITLEKRGYLTRQDFKHHEISMSRWTQGGWIIKTRAGGWVRGPHFPDFRQQHPVNFVQIHDDYETWKAPSATAQIEMRSIMKSDPVIGDANNG